MNRWLLVLALPLVMLATCFATPAVADKRVALVIGNSAYRNVALLENPGNDARLIADTLRDLGFALVGGGAQLDLDKTSFDRAVQSFGAQLQGADIGLFFYAGHGVQVRGTNYLIPVDANPTREADADFQMLDTTFVLRQMEGAGARLNLIILDACRNNPFGGRGLVVGRGSDRETVRLRDTASGLAQMQAPEGTLISFATQPGSVARDGIDGHSPYSKALAETIRRPGLGIFDVFNEVGLEVKRATGGGQQPWVSSSPIDGTFYFVPGTGAQQQAALPPRPPQPPQASAPTASASEVRRFDGVWVANWVCESTPAGLARATGRFVGTAKDGVLHGETGQKGMPGGATYDGTIGPDGVVTINVNALSRIPDPYNRPAGIKIEYKMFGVFEGGSGTATRSDRDCDIKFVKQSAGAAAAVAARSAPQSPAPTASTSTAAPVNNAPGLAAVPPLPPSARDSVPASEVIDVRRFDGSWVADMACAASAEPRFAQPLAFARQVFVSITNGVLHGERGPQGKPGSEQWNGTIEPDGSMAIAVSGINGSKARRPNSDFNYQLGGRLEGSQGSAIRAERDCNVKFAKRPAGAGTIVPRPPQDRTRDVHQR
jgi:hypothetical protein